MVLRLVGRPIGAKPLPFWAPFGFHFVFYNSRQKMWSSFCVFSMLLGSKRPVFVGPLTPYFYCITSWKKSQIPVGRKLVFGFMGEILVSWGDFSKLVFGFMGRFFHTRTRLCTMHKKVLKTPRPFVQSVQSTMPPRVSSITML